LRERKYFLHTAPHLSRWLPIMLPVSKWYKVPYFWLGTKTYDFLAGSEGIESSYFLPRSKAIEAFPMLRKNNLFGALVYYGMYLKVPLVNCTHASQTAPIMIRE
jgi:glycerol-3-phosphate dehydrogenase